ncbi:MAG: S-layer homology domain-containing protein [Candidatus Aminicenantes bacterium]|nr:S-layer homology domain-containing protein [Candidatus Aminicenantes bacterium]
MTQALNHYQTALKLAPNDRVLLREYAETLQENDDLSKSLDVYEKLRELNPQDKEVSEKITFLKNKLGIVEIPSLYHQIPQSSAITRQDLAAIIGVKFYQYLPEPKNTPIIVDIGASWASKFIIRVTGNAIMDIYENHTFEPNRVITRAELAETFYRLINHLKSRNKKLIPQIPENKIMISDIPADNLYYYPAVQMVAYQLMELSPGKKFLPEAPVAGNEALRIADLLLNLIN